MRSSCPGSPKPIDFTDACIRDAWSAIVPAAFALVFLVFLIPIPGFLKPAARWLGSPFQGFITVQEADALADPEFSSTYTALDEAPKGHVSLRRTVLLTIGAVLEALGWLALGVYRAVALHATPAEITWPILVSATWVYVAARRPKATPNRDVFTLYLIHLATGVVLLGGALYEKSVYTVPLPPALAMAGLIINVVIILVLTGAVLFMPMGIPGPYIKPEEIGKTVSPEEYMPFWQWWTFQWIYPIVSLGNTKTLGPEDVWPLSTTYQSRAVFTKFQRMKRSTLVRRIWASNSQDFILDFTLTLLAATLKFASPFFLNGILSAIQDEYDPNAREHRARAYVYAFLTFVCAILKSQLDMHRLWFNRRAATRVRTELMAAVYDKSLKRRDLSGSVDKDKEEDEAKGKDKNAEKDKKAGADIGKIVNLMSGDAMSFSNMLQGVGNLYGAPLEIVIGLIFLYRLLGVATFAGFAAGLLLWPFNSWVMKRAHTIFKGVASARDKRMAAVNELISSVKFIKFFAWESRWIQRVLAARETEIKWLIKARINSLLFNFTWSIAPMLVNIVAFLVFVALGNQLTVAVAFTAVALFNMLSTPLNMIPAFTVHAIEAFVALGRIATYLEEDEVDEQVSVLKRGSSWQVDENVDITTFGIENGTFEWNATSNAKGNADSNASETGSATAKAPEAPEAARNGDSISLSGTEILKDHHFELRDISVTFPHGELTVVAGPTASGKSALLLALLGEMTRTRGRLVMFKDPTKVDEHGLMYAISYAAQTPWLRHQSIKDNILFGYPYDEQRYNDVVECCALDPDFEQLEDGDSTEIGARGISLSGGQKARVALARAVYARTRIVLLDDPLSAVDSHTARFLFDRLLRGPLLANRTVVLVTHHVELVLPGTHYLVRMLDGRIDTQGLVKELRSQGILEEVTREENVEMAEGQPVSDPAKTTEPAIDEPDKATKDKKSPAKLVEEEKREEGAVKWSIYRTYLRASSYWTWVFVAIFIVIVEILGLGIKLWMKAWDDAYRTADSSAVFILPAEKYSHSADQTVFLNTIGQPSGSFSTSTLPSASTHPFFYVGIYTALTLATAFISNISVITLFVGSIRASRILFKQLLTTVVAATFRWHDVTPQGRMLNRFGNDMKTIDSSLAMSLSQVNESLASFFASVLTIIVILPGFLVPAFVIALAYRQLAIRYLNTGRDLRRMESNTRSPIFSGFTELLEGIVTVRAFCSEKRFMDNLHVKIDQTTQMWYTFWMTNRWLLLNFEALGAISIYIATLFALSGYLSAGLAAICITSAMSFRDSTYWTCRIWTSLELDLNAVERVVEYLDLPQEPPAMIESSKPPAYWPSSSNEHALVTVEELVVKYAPDLPPVLHGVSFDIRGKERVGLLGRTGSGKSTLAMSLLRFTEPSSGRILIDGIDITKIGVQDLRSRLTFIPQDATLFSGTLRENLDPFGEHEDGECLDVLRRVHLIGQSGEVSRATSQRPSRASSVQDIEREETTESTSPTIVREDTESSATMTVVENDSKTTITLDTQISAGGTNMSLGQRQLIAMARALLRRSSIIILDEATSSIDFATDAKIQTAIREEFSDALLLTIAHRISTVIDYDRLIILDKGKIAEYDTPYNLLQKEDSIFRSMCKQSGMFEELETAAKAKARLSL